MEIVKNLTLVNFTDRNDISRIKKIVIHYFGALGSAKNTCQYFKSVYRQASAHYFVDDDPIIYQAVEDEDISWHCGDSGIGTHKGIVTNSNSIGIEVRPYKLSTKTMSAMDNDWYFTEATINNLEWLVNLLLDRYPWLDPSTDIVRHFDVTAKWCPRPWMGDDINVYYNDTGNNQWNKFLERVGGDMSYEKFCEYMDQWLADRDKLPTSEWAEDDMTWAHDNGLINGKGAVDSDGNEVLSGRSFLTREEYAAVEHRQALRNK